MNVQYKKALAGVVIGMQLVTVVGCVPTTPQWDATFGETVRTAVAQQTLNPDASRDTDTVSGIDGNAGAAAITLYRESFTKPQPQPDVFTIGVGGGK